MHLGEVQVDRASARGRGFQVCEHLCLRTWAAGNTGVMAFAVTFSPTGQALTLARGVHAPMVLGHAILPYCWSLGRDSPRFLGGSSRKLLHLRAGGAFVTDAAVPPGRPAMIAFSYVNPLCQRWGG